MSLLFKWLGCAVLGTVLNCSGALLYPSCPSLGGPSPSCSCVGGKRLEALFSSTSLETISQTMSKFQRLPQPPSLPSQALFLLTPFGFRMKTPPSSVRLTRTCMHTPHHGLPIGVQSAYLSSCITEWDRPALYSSLPLFKLLRVIQG